LSSGRAQKILPLETYYGPFETVSMQSGRHIVNIALIGFMGTGKTSVGRLLAEQLHFHFLDTDELIQSHTGRTVGDIFSRDGEVAFRTLERQVVTELDSAKKSVIATGGGLPTHGENLARLKTHALVVCLWASPEKIWERVRYQSHRPLLHDADPQKKIQELLAAREPFYRQADVLINTDLRFAREVSQNVALQFKFATRPPR
jgi:shikimate kinase